MNQQRYDVVIVGGGAAGLNGALMLLRARRSVLVVDDQHPRNAPAAHMHGFLSRDGMPPGELLESGRQEVRGYGGEIVTASAVSASREPDGFLVGLDNGHGAHARRLLVATGVTDELPDIPGVDEPWGRDVLHCPYCHGWEVRDQPIGVLATGPLAVHQTLMFRQWTDKLTLLQHTAPRPADEEIKQLDARDVAIVAGEVTALEVTEGRLSGVRLRTGEQIPLRALVIGPRFSARSGVLTALGMEPSAHPNGAGTYIEADATGLTAVPGVWVAGNLVEPRAQVLGAAHSGATAASAINAELITEDTQRAVGAKVMSQQVWDEMYSGRDQVWSGAPNGVLVTEVAGLPPGRALDIGCGEGADSLWLAEKGWCVTAVDVSEVALDRAATLARETTFADDITWTHADLSTAPLPAGEFDLVSVQYFPIPYSADPSHSILDGLLAAVAPGGTLLIVSHALADLARQPNHGPDPRDFYQPGEIATLLGDDWTIQVNEETRERVSPPPEGTHHTHDTVFRSRRLR